MQGTAVGYLIRPMRLVDIPQVMEVEQESFPTTWPRTAFRYELEQNRLARYLVAVETRRPGEEEPAEGSAATPPSTPAHGTALGRLLDGLRHVLPERHGEGSPSDRGLSELVVGFIGVWLMVDEAHIVTVAVRRSHRRHGIGELLLMAAIELAQGAGQPVVTLECRVSNLPALSLYEKYGFQQVGVRPGYYTDNHEDAYILSLSPVTSQAYRDRFQALKAAHQRRYGLNQGPA